MVASSQCHLARRRPGTPQSQVGIWITDLMLQQAIGQFQRRSLVTNRSMGSHKVPSVSNRRPVSRRQLTEAMPSSQYQPLWWFELIGNPHAWQWQPPSTPDERREKEKHLTWARSVDKIIAWLEASDLDKPFLDPPTDSIDQQSINPAESIRMAVTVQNAEAVETFAEESQVVAAEVSPQTLASHIENLKSAIATFSDADSKALYAAVRSCCDALEVRILCAQFASSEVSAVLAALTNLTRDSPLPRNILDGINQRIKRTIVRAVCSLCPTESPGVGAANHMADLYTESMAAILSNIHEQVQALQGYVFSQLMKSLQTQDTFVSHIIMDIVQATVKETATTHIIPGVRNEIRATSFSAYIQLTDRICHLPEHIRQKVAAYMRDVYFDNPTLRLNYRGPAFVWLFVAIRGGLYTKLEETLLIKDFKHHFTTELKSSELVALGMQRLVQDRVLDKAQHTSLVARLEKHTYPPFFLAVMLDGCGPNSSKRRVVEDMIAWVLESGERVPLLYAMVVPQISRDHPDLAITAREMMIVYLNRPRTRQYRFLYEVQRVGHIVGSYAHLRPDAGADCSEHLDWRLVPQVIDSLATYYAENTELTDRQLQRGIEWCLVHAEFHHGTGVGSEVVLQALTDVFVRDLARGKPIVYAKKQYLVSKVEQYQGREKAERVTRKLAEWEGYIEASHRVKEARLPHAPGPWKRT